MKKEEDLSEKWEIIRKNEMNYNVKFAQKNCVQFFNPTKY